MFGANNQFGKLIPGGLAGAMGQSMPQAQTMAPAQSMLGAPLPTGDPGRIPTSTMGQGAGSLASLFAAVDKGVKASNGSSAYGFDPKNPWNYYNGQTFTAGNKPDQIPEGWKIGSNADGSQFTLLNRTPEFLDAESQRMQAIQDMKNGGGSGSSGSSNSAFNDANSFLQGLGLAGSGPATGSGLGGGSGKGKGNKQQGGLGASNAAAAAAPALTGEPGRIPVSTGTATGSITTKPPGVSGADWKRYQSLSAKLANSKTISSKNQSWYDAFVKANGTAGPPAGGGGGTPGGGGVIPGGVAPPPGVVNPQLGLLTRPYDNPFERRNLWNLFPQGQGQ